MLPYNIDSQCALCRDCRSPGGRGGFGGPLDPFPDASSIAGGCRVSGGRLRLDRDRAPLLNLSVSVGRWGLGLPTPRFRFSLRLEAGRSLLVLVPFAAAISDVLGASVSLAAVFSALERDLPKAAGLRYFWVMAAVPAPLFFASFL